MEGSLVLHDMFSTSSSSSSSIDPVWCSKNSELSTASQPQHHHHHHPELLSYNNQRYGNMADQFQPHTPSFGDDEFDIGSLGLMGHHVVMAPLPAEHQQQQQHVQQQQQQHHPMMHQQHQFQQQQQQQHHQPMYHNNSLPATDPSGGHHYGMYNNPHMDGGGYTLQTLGSSPPPQQQQQQQQPVNRYSPQQQQQQQQNASATRINLECRAMPEGSVVEMQQQHRISNPGTTVMAPPSWTGGVVVPTTVNTSPLGSNVSATPPSGDTSEESGDDSHSILLMGNAVKRPSPEPLDATPVRNMGGAQAAKKPKVTQAKKKKRRDPHEPQKPVSAYALFFRDTQAAIKGQNPNASFGEVSKIVASMWDALDTDSKNVYKKKTEAAKKEYLKALAAYRASVVSKEGNGEPQAQPPMFQPPPPQQQQQTNNFPVNNYQQNQYNIPQQQQQQQQQYTASMATVSAPHLSPNKKATPLLNSLMADQQQQQQFHQQQNMQMQYPPMNNQQQQQQRPAYMNQQQAAPQMIQQTMNYSQHLMQQQGQQQGQQQQVQQQRVLNQVPTPSQLGNKPAVNNGNNGLQHPHCIRSGCPNAAIPSPDWENEYCSNECVVSHCRDVFSAWVASSQGAPPGYPPPVK